MAREISNSDDTIDSRDVIERIAELQDERQGLADALDEAKGATGEDADTQLTDANDALKDWDEDNGAELKALMDFAGEAEGYASDWTYGAQLICDSYFTEAMQELCADIGDVPKDMPAYLVIDWEATAENLKVDYTSVEFDGVTYWVR